MKQGEAKAEAVAAETRLLQSLSQGDTAAFDVLFGRYQAKLHRYALRMSGSASVADDVVQDVFLALIRGGHGYQASAGALQPYLFGIARNLVRRAAQDGFEDTIDEDQVVDNGETDPLEGLSRLERVERVRQAVGALPFHYREAVVLCDLEELTYEEVALAMKCSIGTVRSRLHRGRELLLSKLREVRCLI